MLMATGGPILVVTGISPTRNAYGGATMDVLLGEIAKEGFTISGHPSGGDTPVYWLGVVVGSCQGPPAPTTTG